MLFIFGGLPASGKSTISQRLTRDLAATYIRVDTIEDTLRDGGLTQIHGEGYDVAYALAADNLALGLTVVADSVNCIEITRSAWRAVGQTADVAVMEIEIVCSDQDEHRQRLETRASNTESAAQLTWDDVIKRDYEPWPQADMVIDTARESPEQSFEKTLTLIRSRSR